MQFNTVQSHYSQTAVYVVGQ